MPCVFQDKWLRDVNFMAWLRRDTKPNSAYCCLCNKHIDITTMGRTAVTSHMKGQKHTERVKIMNSQRAFNNYLQQTTSEVSVNESVQSPGELARYGRRMASDQCWKNEIGVMEMFLSFYDLNSRGGTLRDCLFDVLNFYEENAMKLGEKPTVSPILGSSNTARHSGNSSGVWNEQGHDQTATDVKEDNATTKNLDPSHAAETSGRPMVKTEAMGDSDCCEVTLEAGADIWNAAGKDDMPADEAEEQAWQRDAEMSRLQMIQSEQPISLPGEGDLKAEAMPPLHPSGYPLSNYFPPQRMDFDLTMGQGLPQTSNTTEHNEELPMFSEFMIQKPRRKVECPICHKTFSSQTVLRQHERVHTDERPYTCPLCAKSYKHKHRLKDHMLQHSGSKPYKCHVCHKPFRRSDSLKTHLQVHFNHRQRMQRQMASFSMTEQLLPHPAPVPSKPVVLIQPGSSDAAIGDSGRTSSETG